MQALVTGCDRNLYLFCQTKPSPCQVAGADDLEAARSDPVVCHQGKPANLFPAQAFEFERVHANLGSRIRAALVVLIDCLGDRFEVLGFSRQMTRVPFQGGISTRKDAP
jgi:hypothetical protein